ncbi:MAG: hypothetical protein JW702_09430 [Clostridiales bacterium]|nr:hypothetical protein [Clostridiales bacterium]
MCNAASSKQVVEASLGHYITPVIIIVIGALVLREKVAHYKMIALLLTLIGVGYLVFTYGRVPIIAMLLIISFVGYTSIKKFNQADVMIAFAAELLALFPIALSYLFFKNTQGISFFYTGELKDILLLISTGAFTGYTLLFFSKGVKGIDFTNLGFIQYMAPSISLLIGIFIFHEAFNRVHIVSFSLIWVAIAIVVSGPIFKWE